MIKSMFMVIAQRTSAFRFPANVIASKHAQVILRRFSANPRFNTAIDSLAGKKSHASSSKNKASASKRTDTTTDWEETPNFSISQFSELPHTNFGINQHIIINNELKEALRQVLWYFRAPIRYAFVYGSGVFPQSNQASILSSNTSVHPHAPSAVTKAQRGAPKMIDFIFGVSHTQHWHSLNLAQNRHHYSMLGSFGSGAVSLVQDRWGAGVYFNPYVTVNGMMIKYGVVNIDTICTDLTEWKTLYLAGRLQKPVKILRDDARVRLANQINLISALRTALLLLPSDFTEYELYNTITSISYMGDPRMMLHMENPKKVENIVGNNLQNFRQLYSPLIRNLPNICFKDLQHSNPDLNYDPSANLRLAQDMDPVKRANMVRRLPKAFRSKLYFEYQKKYRISGLEFEKMLEDSKDEDAIRINRREGGGFERKIANEPPEHLRTEIKKVIRSTVKLPSINQSLKGAFTAGPVRTWRYLREKMAKNKQGRHEVGRS
ncbi:Phosphatidate cytidylyltransferase, mitochondrial [Golovinomyces cichoracearum]|uniref:Phosphatidate cytidylyltransferase, mitochondrial n=1 Tax=Golovinomyces cichoracearum TaxID=62708 RepID=A0A420J427_9PEZI|nr:Phosphatidate cytidylyltransferase, mitochondrial [Golovinomyces cichoracearum]